MNKKKIVNLFGRLLMVLSFVLIAAKLWGYREEISVSLNTEKVLLLILCAAVYGFFVYILPFMYKNLIRITTGRSFPFTRISYLCCKTGLYKYLPGNVMQYIGKNQLAVEENLSHLDVALATVLEITITVFSAVFVSVVFSARYVLVWMEENNINWKLILLGGALLAVICLLLLVLLAKKFKSRFEKYLRLLTPGNIGTYLGLILYNSVISVLNGVIYFCVLGILGTRLNLPMYMAGIGLYQLSFLVGYITPGVPGGIGVREAVLLYFFADMMPQATILSGALIFRIISILGDIFGYLLSAGGYWLKNGKIRKKPD